MRVLWNSECTFEVTFIAKEALGYQSNHEEHKDFHIYHAFNVSALNKVIHALRRDDLNVKRWKDHICIIGVQRCGGDGFILFRATHPLWCWESTLFGDGYHPCRDTIMRFSATRGEALEFHQRAPPNLDNIPEHLQRRIFRHVFAETGSVFINVDHDDPSTVPIPGRLLVNRHMHTSLIAALRTDYWSEAFNFSMHATDMTTSFSDFKSLRKWLCLASTPGLPYRGRFLDRLEQSEGIRLSLHINIPVAYLGSESPRSLRIDIMPLILSTAHLSAVHRYSEEDHVFIDIYTTIEVFDDSKQRSHSKVTVPLRDLRNSVLRGLIRKLANEPSISDAKWTKFYIDGRGLVHDDKFTWESSRPNTISDGSDWNPDWVRHDGPFDGTTACVVKYLWSVFTGGQPDACARKCKYNATYERSTLGIDLM